MDNKINGATYTALIRAILEIQKEDYQKRQKIVREINFMESVCVEEVTTYTEKDFAEFHFSEIKTIDIKYYFDNFNQTWYLQYDKGIFPFMAYHISQFIGDLLESCDCNTSEYRKRLISKYSEELKQLTNN